MADFTNRENKQEKKSKASSSRNSTLGFKPTSGSALIAEHNKRYCTPEGRLQAHKDRVGSLSAHNRMAPIQAKLEVNEPGDAFEQEADQIAEKVVGNLHGAGDATPSDSPNTPPIQRKEAVNTRSVTAGPGMQVPNSFAQQISTTKGQGSPISSDTRAEMEAGFGADFSRVRLHTDDDAVQLSRNINAQAFTQGQNIYFNDGKLDTGSTEGKKLLAHELTHTLQQGDGVRRKEMEVGEENEQSDQEEIVLMKDRLNNHFGIKIGEPGPVDKEDVNEGTNILNGYRRVILGFSDNMDKVFDISDNLDKIKDWEVDADLIGAGFSALGSMFAVALPEGKEPIGAGVNFFMLLRFSR